MIFGRCFDTPLGRTLEALASENRALPYTKRLFSQSHLFRFRTVFYDLLAQKGSKHDTKMAPKIDRKSNDFFIAKSNELLGKMEPKWTQNGSKFKQNR